LEREVGTGKEILQNMAKEKDCGPTAIVVGSEFGKQALAGKMD